MNKMTLRKNKLNNDNEPKCIKGYECLAMGNDIFPLNVRNNQSKRFWFKKKTVCKKKERRKTRHDVVAINE